MVVLPQRDIASCILPNQNSPSGLPARMVNGRIKDDIFVFFKDAPDDVGREPDLVVRLVQAHHDRIRLGVGLYDSQAQSFPVRYSLSHYSMDRQKLLIRARDFIPDKHPRHHRMLISYDQDLMMSGRRACVGVNLEGDKFLVDFIRRGDYAQEVPVEQVPDMNYGFVSDGQRL